VVDAEKLTSSVQALLENAIKFSPENSVVTISTQETRDRIVICVVDQGMGIHSEDIPHLGERHYRGKMAREKRIDGIGLGLRIVQFVVEGHHGVLKIESAPGKGSTFQLEIPKQGEEA
jgi:signal transduction histidine kinase